LSDHAPQIDKAFVFGSVAKATDSKDSDIDLMLIGQLSSKEHFALMSALTYTLGRQIHITSYEPDEWDHLVETDPVVSQIAAGPKLQVLPDDDSTTA
jgi:uncharacterized protein